MTVTTTGLQRRPTEPLFSGNAGKPPKLPIHVTTSPVQWAYAVGFNRVKKPLEHSGPVVIRITVEVTRGEIGVGCLNSSNTEFIDEEFVRADDGPTAVELVALHVDTIGPLIVRNVSAAGLSEAHILDLRCFALVVPPDDVRDPGLSEPQPAPRWERFYGAYGTTAIEKLRVQRFRALDAPALVQWVDGLQARILPNDQLSRALFVSGTYEPNTLLTLRRLLREGDVFVDVGANAGIISLAASRWVGKRGRVYAFEPSAREYGRLLDNLALNKVENVTPVRAAVSSSSGRATLRVAAASHAGLNTVGNRFAYDGVDTAAIEDVTATTLDESIAGNAVGRVSVIKLDVEGAEGEALKGAIRLLEEHRPALVLEIVPRALDANGWDVPSLEQLLRDARYRLFSIHHETAMLEPIASFGESHEQNVAALPEETVFTGSECPATRGEAYTGRA